MVDLLKIVDRLKSLPNFSTEKQIASELGLSAQDLSKRKKSGSDTLIALITRWGINQGVNLDWLFTGEGEPFAPQADTLMGEGPNHFPDSKEMVHDENQDVGHLLKLTREVLHSNTGYSFSLAANIRSFHQAICTEIRLKDIEHRLATLEKLKGKQDIRSDDDPANKEEIIKRRATSSG